MRGELNCKTVVETVGPYYVAKLIFFAINCNYLGINGGIGLWLCFSTFCSVAEMAVTQSALL